MKKLLITAVIAASTISTANAAWYELNYTECASYDDYGFPYPAVFKSVGNSSALTMVTDNPAFDKLEGDRREEISTEDLLYIHEKWVQGKVADLDKCLTYAQRNGLEFIGAGQ